MVQRNKFLPHCSTQFKIKNRIGITTGDPAGVGCYVFKKALQELGLKKNFQFIIWTSKKTARLRVKGFVTKILSSSHQIDDEPFCHKTLLQIQSQKSTVEQLKDCARKTKKKELSAMITGPTDKTVLKKSDKKALGQTDILKRFTKSRYVFQAFLGQKFNVILLNDHRAFFKTSLKNLKPFVKEARQARKFLKNKKSQPLALLGLNPHAGEQGILGKEELSFPQFGKEIKGPLSPDVAFLKKNWKKFSFYLALYHDQGLIPFKMAHEQDGVVLSLGLPFIRMGVTHGTGYKLKARNISHRSAKSCLKFAIYLIQQNRENEI